MLAELREKTERLLPQVRGIQAVPVSAETGRGLDKLMDAVIEHAPGLEPPHLDRQAQPLAGRHSGAPSAAGRRRPPAEDQIHDAGQDPPAGLRGLLHAPGIRCRNPISAISSNSLREAFDMPGVPIRIVLRASENPFARQGARSGK